MVRVMTSDEIIEWFNSNEDGSITGGMYGGMLSNDTPIKINKSDLIMSRDKDAFYYLWGYQGPDYTEFRFEDYGITWRINGGVMKNEYKQMGI